MQSRVQAGCQSVGGICFVVSLNAGAEGMLAIGVVVKGWMCDDCTRCLETLLLGGNMLMNLTACLARTSIMILGRLWWGSE